MIPQLDAKGLLPIGVWDCSLEDISDRFAFNDHRRALWDGFRRFLNDARWPHSLVAPIWIDGSYCRSKAMPSDIDVVIDLSDRHPLEVEEAALRLRFRHAEIKARYHVDLWVRHPALPNDLAAFFQYVGDKAAAELQLQPKDPKGILRVLP